MNSYKKIFFFLFLTFLSNSNSHAAYQNPWKINDYEILKKAEAMETALVAKQTAFWAELKLCFKNEQICQHKMRGYLSIIEFLYDRIQNKAFNKQGMSYGWKDIDIVEKTFDKYFSDDRPFYAFILIRNMILSSALFNTLEKNDQSLKNGFKAFWGPVQDIFNNKDQNVHRLCSFCEIIIFLKNLEHCFWFASADLSHADQFAKEKTIFGDFMNYYKGCLLLDNLKCKWHNLDLGLWSIAIYKLIENFCLNSQVFQSIEK